MTRRELFVRCAAGALAPAGALTIPAAAQEGGVASSFVLPPLPYPADALEPYIDAQTMEIHHGRHHAAYVSNLNKALSGVGVKGKSLEELLEGLDALPEPARTAVRNNGGGHLNHTLFWNMMKKAPAGEPRGELAKAIQTSFGSFTAFRERFTAEALGRFGSGWAWLVLRGGRLELESTPNQDTPVMTGGHPVLGIDVWEHAYYLKYQNRRADYVSAWFHVVNWDFAAERYREGLKS